MFGAGLSLRLVDFNYPTTRRISDYRFASLHTSSYFIETYSTISLECSGGIKGGMGAFSPSRRLFPHLPPLKRKKMAKISNFLQIFEFLPAQNRICPLDATARM